MAETTSAPRLQPCMGPGMLALYGLGSMLGAGIYGLVGQAAGIVGGAVWMSFVVAMMAALLTGLCYASLGSRYPRAGGAAYIIERAFKRRVISYTAGLAVVASGLTSMATGSRIVAQNVLDLTGLAAWLLPIVALVYLVLLCALVWRGLKESLWFNALCTCVEAGGLLFVIIMGARFWGSTNLLETPTAEHWYSTGLLVLQSSVLTFFAFLGFEDTLNVSEEVKNPQRNVPIGLISAMIAATVIYLGIAVTAVSVVRWDELSQAAAPLSTVMERAAPWLPTVVYQVITVFAVANTALINFVMGSRLVFGMARQGLLPEVLTKLHPTQNTPHYAATAIFCVAGVLVFVGNVGQLAAATVILLLIVFTLMNLAQLVLARREGEPDAPIKLPAAVPIAGATICVIMLIGRAATGEPRAPIIAGVLLLVILGVYALTRKTHRPDAMEEPTT